ncbi:MAG: 6-bladed beta-propeller [Cytophagales bacterium]|nr:6-bladed beta-propeller [Cytophagales bacterium]
MKIDIFFTILIIVLKQASCTYNKNVEVIECTKTFNDNQKVEFLKFPEIGEDTLKASFFADTVIYIPLETTNESLIQTIRKQIWVGDSIILINNRFNLLMFLRSGEFVRKIGKRGKGPGENQSIFCFDILRDTIHLSSSGKRSLIRYTMDGDFCDEIQFNGQPFYFNSTTNNEFAWYNFSKGEIYVYNEDLNRADTIVIEHGVTEGRYKFVHYSRHMPYFQKTATGLLFNNYLSDTVWAITKGEKEPAFILNMNDKLLPWEKQVEFCEGDFKKWQQIAKSYEIVHLIPFSRYIIIFQKHWIEKSFSAIYLQNRLTREIERYNTSFIYDDMVGWQKLSNFIFTGSTDFLVAVIYPHELQEDLNSNRENIKERAPPIWLNQMKSIDENDNPILVLIKVKK